MERRAITVRGIVQGVGFRPFVYNLAAQLQLVGFVRNQTGSVLIEVEGEAAALERFMAELGGRPPPLAQIDDLRWEPRLPQGEGRFCIETSAGDPASAIFISPDVATCADCRAELFDPANRRYRYPFLNCTNCGPRLTIITGAPYDRAQTTMASFAMCPACREEYDNPADRRFHAQPTACADCGPALQALDAAGKPIETGEALGCFVTALREGKIGALKGLGGYHLVCAAGNAAAVAELRRRKHRDEKPFAIMVADLAGAEALCHVSPAERDLLAAPGCPIVLLRQKGTQLISAAGNVSSPGSSCRGNELRPLLAPGNPLLGVMLPYTPLHHLLLAACDGGPLVMTSGNRSDEPIAYRDDEALAKLSGIADIFLIHNRPIHVRCDDSVTRIVDGLELLLRRSRGYAPRPIALPSDCAGPILAVGGQLKATFALGRGRQAFLSHHLGDLDHFDAYQAFVKDVALYEELFAIRPELIAHDAHPDYMSTRYARQRAADDGSALLSIQHHHAHLASCMAEHGLDEPVIGVTFDGTGFGPDGAVWGGEFLSGDYRQFQRAAHFRYVGMPGGEQAIREPWRMALAHLADACASCPSLRARVLPQRMKMIEQMLDRQVNTPQTSSAGRLFDAVAALCGVRDRVTYEGQAAVELEWLASGVPVDRGYPFELVWDTHSPSADGPDPPAEQFGYRVGPLVIDTRPLITAVAHEANQGVTPAVIARRFHTTLVEIVAEVCSQLRATGGPDAVVLSGGVFLNALLTSEVSSRLQSAGLRVYRHRLVPPGDGGLSLGQLAIAACHSRKS